MATTMEVNMYPEAYLELPMSKPVFPGDEEPNNPFGINLSISEKFIGEQFDYMQIDFSVSNSDPRLRAVDIYTQYSGCRSILVKHFPLFWPNGIIHKNMFPTWSNSSDRVLEEGSTGVKEITEYVDYNGATGLNAHSYRKVLSPEGTLTLGMLRGTEPDQNNELPWLNPETGINRILVKLSEHKVLETGNEPGDSIAISDHFNPMCEVSFELEDRHPIPCSVYMIDYYWIDNDGTYKKETIPGQLYNPDHLKAGEIISKTGSPGKKFMYSIRVVTAGNSNGLSWETLVVDNQWGNFEVGQFVIVCKIGSLSSPVKGEPEPEPVGWTIQYSSKLYWRRAVEFLRE